MSTIAICHDIALCIGMTFEEHPVCFACHDSWLYGILSVPDQPLSRGIVIVVGGPQYRVGSHRQFTLLARDFASHGFPVIRFDYRGMGDSEGTVRTFNDVGDDLRCAVDQLIEQVPGVDEVVMWGLCDGASAATFYAHLDPRVTGIVLVNPWARTEEGIAKAYLKHYYLSRLFQAELWRRIASGRFDYVAAGRSFSKLIRDAVGQRNNRMPASSGKSPKVSPLPERMFDGLSRFKGKILLIMSGNDMTAKEFSNLAQGSRKWKKLLQSSDVKRLDLPEANHTFSRREWRDQVAIGTKLWLDAW